MKLPRIAEPLRHRDFRLLLAGQTLTLLGTFVSNVAFPFQVIQLGGSAVELGIVTSTFMVSSLVFLLLGGVVADRLPRRTVILATEVASGVVMTVLALLGYGGRLEMWHLYLGAAYFGAATAFAIPAIGAIIPELVPEEILVPGNALRGLSRQAARVGGPVIGGLLVAFASPAAAFAFDAVSFFASAGLVALTVGRQVEGAERRSILAEIREGLAFVFSVQWLWVTIFGWSLVSAAFIGAFAVGLPLLVTDVLRAGPTTFGIITAAVGAGEAVGAAVMAQVRIRRVGIAMYSFATIGNVALFLYGAIANVPGAIMASALLGFGFVCFGVLWESALQKHVPRRMLGRVTSVDWFGGTLLGPIAPVVAVILVQTYGPAGLFLIAGAVATVFTLGGFLFPSIRRLE